MSLDKLEVSKQDLRGLQNGCRVYWRNGRFSACVRRLGRRLRCAGRAQMNSLYVLGAVASAGLLVYLVVALLKAEDL
jgi:K+-transporting ATPase KdpF subunit